MNIQVNGEPRDIHEGMSVAGLLRHLEIRGEQVAVEVNREILDKQGFETRLLCAGDQIEILSFIGGG